jgi:ATP-dependent DNA helicase PIF1
VTWQEEIAPSTNYAFDPQITFRSPLHFGMPSCDNLSLAFSFCIAALLCCMLFALLKLSARLPHSRAASLPHLHLHPHLHSRVAPTFRSTTTSRPRLSSHYGYLTTQPHSVAPEMFKQAVKSHGAVASSQKTAVKPPAQQQSLNNAFKAKTQIPTTRFFTAGSGNVQKYNVPVDSRPTGHSQGIKRTSSGLAKALSLQEEGFEHGLDISDSDDQDFKFLDTGRNTLGQNPVYFDEDDFDSDIDLELEDPASKGTVYYPTLPLEPSAPAVSRDSGYRSASRVTNVKQEEASSQPIPWSSSPAEHFRTPKKPPPPQPSKRRTLPWLQNSQVKTELELEPESEIEDEPEVKPKNRKLTQATPVKSFTPLPKDTAKSAYQWNTTASGIKEQQKNLREANKMMKANEAADDDMKRAVSKKKKNTVHRIFLSEEQQHVLNLCVENKKSVFFTGSAGMLLLPPNIDYILI